MPRGILDTQYIDLPVGLDLTYVEGLRIRGGTTFPEVLNQLDQRLAAFNNSADPFIASISSRTSELYQDIAWPIAFEIEEAGEYTVARPQYADKAPAPMLPIRKWDVSTEWTEDGLTNMSLSGVNLQFDSLLMGLRKQLRRRAISRLFSNAEIRVDKKTSATNPGFAGSGTGQNVFAPPTYPDGTAIPGGYTHYIRETAANRGASILTLRDQIRKWYPSADIHLAGTKTFIDAVRALTGFTRAGSAFIRLPDSASEALVDANLYWGVYDDDVLVHKAYIDEVQGDYGVVYVTFGPFNTNNALAWRFDELYGADAFLRSRSLFPLDQAIVIHRYDFGVSNRVAAGLIQIAGSAGAYQNPTIN